MSTIYVKLMGGLGNQMFQYATGRALALHHGADLKLDLSFFETYQLRRYELGVYPIAAAIAKPRELAQVRPIRPRPVGFLERLRALQWRKPLVMKVESSLYFDATLIDSPLPLYLDGYWQSEKYFKSYRSRIIEELTPKARLAPDNIRFLSIARSRNSIALHVRRGDYASNAHTNKYHGLAPLEYYENAIAFLIKDRPDSQALIFSDDMEWVRANLRLDIPITFVDVNGPDRAYQDIYLQASCHHQVIANSSFSWWGAWLNTRQGKIVVAPKN